MNGCKAIQSKFWQNTFVLELSPEERYFYMYLITNTMTTTCGIYKFNMKLAELETGLSIEVIDRYLKFFEHCGKIVISRSTKEIMIVNWFKHNFKNNKRTVSCINKELKDVKDKDFLMQLHEICRERQYPIDELFNGVVLPNAEKDESKIAVQAAPEILQEQKEQVEEVEEVETTSREETKKLPENPPVLFSGFKTAANERKRRKRKERVIEEVPVDETVVVPEEDIWQEVQGETIASWSFVGAG